MLQAKHKAFEAPAYKRPAALIQMSTDAKDSFRRPFGTRRIRVSHSAEAKRLQTEGLPGTIPPIRPNAGTAASYQTRLLKSVRAMQKSVIYWLAATYKANPPALAQDAKLPSKELKRTIKRLRKQWLKHFDDLAPWLAEYYAKEAEERVRSQLKSALVKHKFAFEFKMTRAMRDVMEATISEQVGLIKSIPEQYFTQIEGSVMRAVAKGGDLATLSRDLQKNYGVTKKRAALIANDQYSKANATLVRARQLEIGIKKAIWVHSHAGKVPRPKHLAFSGKTYDIEKGAPIGDKGQMTWPGFEINCRCVARSVVPGFE